MDAAAEVEMDATVPAGEESGRDAGPAAVDALPMVAIIGRPNVGKSSLFNRILTRRHAIVSDVAGTTRDRLISQASWKGTALSAGGYRRAGG